MSMFAITESPVAEESTITADEFSALEDRVLRTVELLKSEREARLEAERVASELHDRIQNHSAELVRAEGELETLRRERDAVRGRIERLLKQLEEVSL